MPTEIWIWQARASSEGSCSPQYFAAKENAIEWIHSELDTPEPELSWYQAAHRNWRCEAESDSENYEIGMLRKLRLRDAAGIVIDESFSPPPGE